MDPGAGVESESKIVSDVGKGDSLAQLVGEGAGGGILENRMEAPQKLKTRTELQSSNCTTRYYTKYLIYTYTKILI